MDSLDKRRRTVSSEGGVKVNGGLQGVGLWGSMRKGEQEVQRELGEQGER